MNAFELLLPKGETSTKDPPKKYVRHARDKIVFEPQVCPLCGATFTPSYWQWRNQNAHESAGPFCSKKCASTYNGILRNGGEKLPTIKIKIKERLPVMRDFIVPNNSRKEKSKKK